jgi:hypothetical protein
MYICPKVSGYNSNNKRDSFRAQDMVLTNNTSQSERHGDVLRFKQSTRVVPNTCWRRLCWVLLVDEKKRLDADRTFVQGCFAMLLRLIRTALNFATTNWLRLNLGTHRVSTALLDRAEAIFNDQLGLF